MSEPPISQADLVAFAEATVNLKRDDAAEYRAQVNRLREKLESYVSEHPDYGLVKMLLSGSLAKGTALRTINDADVALYVRSDKVPGEEAELVGWLVDRLREAYPQMDPNQINPGDHCVRISFRGTGLDVDVVPVYYDGDPDDRGFLISRETGERVLTSIPLHLKFIRSRKAAHPRHFAQVIRLVKWWVRECKTKDSQFRFKSFLVELVVARLSDDGVLFSDYTEALENFYAYIVKSGLAGRIVFDDYYAAAEAPQSITDPIQVFDPVNPNNNVAKGYGVVDRSRLVGAAEDALDALAEARFATTKGRALDCWKDVLGPSFKVES